jgi:hypothetical protein
MAKLSKVRPITDREEYNENEFYYAACKASSYQVDNG